jgi:hypothetical protein
MGTSKPTRYNNGKGFFGLTDEEYEFLQYDIEQAVADGNKKYGYGGYGYIGEDGNHYLFHDNYKPKRLRSTSKPKPKRPSVEEVAITRGLVRVIKPNLEIKSSEA